MRFLGHRIADKRVLRLIQNWLKAGVIEDGVRIASVKGTPQGAVISPLLANIYLHYVFELWAHQWRRQTQRADMIIVRYADDSVMGFQYEGQAKRFLTEMQDRFRRFGLALHPEKTRLIRFGRFAEQNCKTDGRSRPETFDFLGFTHCCGRDRHGRYKTIRLTVKKRMRATLAALRETLMRRRHEPIGVVAKWLRQVLQGYFNYHAVPGNLKRLDGFRNEVCRAWMRALKRRSQRHRMNWEKFRKTLRHVLPRVRATHPYPEERFFASYPR